jgi:hypothetical protein
VLLLSNQNHSFIYEIEKFYYDVFVVFSNAHQLTHSEFSIFDSTALRWAVKRGIKAKKLVKMCTYMTFDPIVPLEVTTYLDKSEQMYISHANPESGNILLQIGLKKTGILS